MTPKKPLKIAYFGTSEFAVPPLRRLSGNKADFDVVAAVTQPDRPAGRKGELRQSPVAEAAQELGIAIKKYDSLKDGGAATELEALETDFFVVAAYGKILPQKVLDIPRFASVNLHGSLLPKYRGASPIQTAILEGERVTGVSLMLMDAEMDHGPVYDTAECAIDRKDTHETFEKKLSLAAADLLEKKLALIAEGKLEPARQEHSKATFTKILKKEDGLIDWTNEDAGRIERKTRAYQPWPEAYANWDRSGKTHRIKILEAKSAEYKDGECGEVFKPVDGYPCVVSADRSAVKILKLQMEGKKLMDGKDFLNGYPDLIGSKLT